MRRLVPSLATLALLAITLPAAGEGPASPRAYLRLQIEGSHSTHVRFYGGPGGGLVLDRRLAPGQSVILPYDDCYLWQRTYGASDIDWSPLNNACPPPRRHPLPGPGPHVLTHTIVN